MLSTRCVPGYCFCCSPSANTTTASFLVQTSTKHPNNHSLKLNMTPSRKPLFVLLAAAVTLLALVHPIVAQTPQPADEATPQPAGPTPAPDQDGTPEPTAVPPVGNDGTPAPVGPTPSPPAAYCAGLTGTPALYGDVGGAGCAWDCDAAFCGCMGATYSDSNGARTCAFGSATASCAVMEKCLRSRIVCVNQYALNNGATLAPGVTAVPPTPRPATPSGVTATEGPASGSCRAASYPLRQALAAVAAGTVAYAGSAVETSCKQLLCGDYLTSMTARYGGTCLSAGAVCKQDPVKPAAPAFVAQIRIGGAGLDAAFQRDPVGVSRAIQSDLARKLGLDFNFVEIISIRIGSLIVDFRVFAPAGVGAAALEALVKQLVPADLTALASVSGATLTVEVTHTGSPDSSSTKCGDGCIAGIVVGSFFFVVILVVVGVFVVRKFGGGSTGSGTKSEPNGAEHHSV
jgi:hypothetical protein